MFFRFTLLLKLTDKGEDRGMGNLYKESNGLKEEKLVFSDENAQTYTEYAILLVLIFVPIFWILKAFIQAVNFNFNLISFFVQLPFP